MVRQDVINCMYEMVRRNARTNRTPSSKASNELAIYVAEILRCNTIAVKSGEQCLTWLIPKFWNVREGYLADARGEKVIDFKNNPLHLWTHSVSFSGTVGKAELERHLFYSKDKPDWIPYHYRNGYRYDANDWGFCLTYNQYLTLNDDEYTVCIDADLDNNGEMVIADCLLNGEHKETVFFAAHNCHPAVATDGLTCIAVLTELFKYLRTRSNRYSYRLIVGPELYAAAAFLEKTPQNEIDNLKNGIFVDMIGNRKPFAYQSSFQGDSVLDKVVDNVFKHSLAYYEKKPYRKLWGNDETFYNGPGFFIPTLGIGGLHHDEYHYDADNLDFVDFEQLYDAVELFIKIIDVLEEDYIPVLKYKGPLYLSRYNVYIDPKQDEKGYQNLEHIQILADGKRTCFEIACELDIDFWFVKSFCDKLYGLGLIGKGYKNLFAQ